MEDGEKGWAGGTAGDTCYAGTLVIQGNAALLTERTGITTEYGKIGLNVAEALEEDTPLQRQTAGLVKVCAAIAAVLFSAGRYFYLFQPFRPGRSRENDKGASWPELRWQWR